MEKTYTIELTAEEIAMIKKSLSRQIAYLEDNGRETEADTVEDLRYRFLDLMK